MEIKTTDKLYWETADIMELNKNCYYDTETTQQRKELASKKWVAITDVIDGFDKFIQKVNAANKDLELHEFNDYIVDFAKKFGIDILDCTNQKQKEVEGD